MTDTAKEKAPAVEGTNVKETIESILVAFILAFIFRAFVVEAFVIPTGSMAPTLLGAHMHFICPDCGYQFDVNYSSPDESDPDDPRIDTDGWPRGDVYCPNCGFHIVGRKQENEPLLPVLYGDRILVMKYIYLLHSPRRWDVVVFKSPDMPAETHYTQNFIKRLVGLPGESLMVLDGNIYVHTADDPTWHIQTKPPDVQDVLWRIIYDNDFHPHLQRNEEPTWVQPWKQTAGTGWNTSADDGGRIFAFDNSTGTGEIDFDPNANSTTQTTTDYLVYDNGSQRRALGRIGSPDDERANPVSDLKVAALYQRKSGDGPFRMELVRHESIDHTFVAELTPDSVRLIHRSQLASAAISDSQIGPTLKLSDLGIKAGDPIFVELMSADYQVTLRLNRKIVLQSTPNDFAPNVQWLLKQWDTRQSGKPGEAAIEADNQSCTLDHIGLWKSIYYTNRDESGQPFNEASPSKPVVLGPTEYFTMGDNSAVSKDARIWPEPINLPAEELNVQAGRVPAQFLLGEAIFVYWPAGYRAFGSVSVIPDFGDMRWIH
ncbi:MAG: S26 family signal peptidase [Tepidisphaeraceae bacterium]|jgi:signal peptidase I